MCKALSPSEFLALSFNLSKKKEMRYDELETIRQKLTKAYCPDGDSYDVDWGHDAVQFTMGFYSPVFSEEDEGIQCDQAKLRRYYHNLLSGLQEADLERLKLALA